MHKPFVFPFFILFALTLGCSGDDVTRSKERNAGMTAVDYNRLVDLNRMQQDNIDAREAVYMVTPSLNEKSLPMSQKIAEKCVRQNGVDDKDDMSGVVGNETITGATSGACPIKWYRRRGWTAATKIMAMTDNLDIYHEDYRNNYSRFSTRAMSGSYGVTMDNMGNANVGGRITISNFQTLDYGRITGWITVKFTRVDDRGEGVIILNLEGNRWVNTASLTWKYMNGGAFNIVYRAGNAKVDEEQFKELFSSYQLDKYMDNAINMK